MQAVEYYGEQQMRLSRQNHSHELLKVKTRAIMTYHGRFVLLFACVVPQVLCKDALRQNSFLTRLTKKLAEMTAMLGDPDMREGAIGFCQ